MYFFLNSVISHFLVHLSTIVLLILLCNISGLIFIDITCLFDLCYFTLKTNTQTNFSNTAPIFYWMEKCDSPTPKHELSQHCSGCCQVAIFMEFYLQCMHNTMTEEIILT